MLCLVDSQIKIPATYVRSTAMIECVCLFIGRRLFMTFCLSPRRTKYSSHVIFIMTPCLWWPLILWHSIRWSDHNGNAIVVHSISGLDHNPPQGILMAYVPTEQWFQLYVIWCAAPRRSYHVSLSERVLTANEAHELEKRWSLLMCTLRFSSPCALLETQSAHHSCISIAILFYKFLTPHSNSQDHARASLMAS